MDCVAFRARSGAPEGLAIAARRQTGGRGRRGRTWSSPEGGLWLSLLLRPMLPVHETGIIGICCGVAAVEALEAVTGLQAGLKWPNDLLVNDRKIGGILVEVELAGNRITQAVVGFGINLNIKPEAFELNVPATSVLIETGKTTSLEMMAAALVGSVERRYHELLTDCRESVLDRWRSLDVMAGRHIRAGMGRMCINGLAAGIGPDGSLLVMTDDGLRSIAYGEVEWM